jgi:hypothetical protein
MGQSRSGSKRRVKLINCLRAGAIAALSCVVINNLYRLYYTHVSLEKVPYEIKEFINGRNITLFSILIPMTAALVYFLVSKLIKKPVVIYIILIVIAFFLSLFIPLSTSLPDGTQKADYEDFYWMSLTMIFLTALITGIVIPVNATVKKKDHD